MTKAMPGYRARRARLRIPLACRLLGHRTVIAHEHGTGKRQRVCWRPGCTWKVRA